MEMDREVANVDESYGKSLKILKIPHLIGFSSEQNKHPIVCMSDQKALSVFHRAGFMDRTM